MKRLIAASMILVLLAAACGSSSKSGSTTTTAKSSTTKADHALAVKANLQLSDFPSGWTAQPADNSNDQGSDAFTTQLATCLNVPVSELQNSDTSVDSDDFSDPDGNVTISSSVDLKAATGDAKHDMSILRRSDAPRCIGDAVKKLVDDEMKKSKDVPQGVTIGQASFRSLSFPTMGDESVAFQIVIPVSATGVSLQVRADLIFIRKGRAEVMISATDPTNSVSISDEQRYGTIVLGRLGSAA
jgi:hypothetical protein